MPGQTANAPLMATVTVAVSAVAWDVMASGGSVINQFKTSRYV